MLYRNYFKRIFDFSFSLLLLIITSPLNIFISVVLFFINKGKIFFIQPRPGKNEKIFFIIKFRTMNEKKDESGELLSDNERLTKIGKFIRNSSLDELPQFINVLKGDLSLIGPRPLLPEYLPLYNDFERKRHKVKPGITGWAQVNGRNSISWEEKFKLDVWYVENLSFRLDLRILVLTLFRLFKTSDINKSENLTMDKFKGSAGK
jgi:undecaprenyl phosphate N,N'-diacetylbacillosamine 1-phosphate transferase